MSTYRLDQLFSPRSVAVVGASPRIGSTGHAILWNLRDAGFQGKLHLVSKDLLGPNGLAFSPDEKYLYVDNWDVKK